MPTIPIPRFEEDMSKEEFLDRLVRLSRTLEYIISHLDHDNVKRLHTEECVIQSRYGETLIKGPTLKMYDTPATVEGSTSGGALRIEMGYSADSSGFIFNMYNAAGTKAITLDSTGNGVITGGTIQTATTGRRIVMNGDELKSLNNDVKDGFVLNGTNGYLEWYLNSTMTGYIGRTTAAGYEEVFISHDHVLITGVVTLDLTSPTISIGDVDGDVFVPGNVEFQGNIGFFNSSAVAQTTVSNLSTDATLTQTIDKLNELIDALQTYNLV